MKHPQLYVYVYAVYVYGWVYVYVYIAYVYVHMDIAHRLLTGSWFEPLGIPPV